MGHLIIFISKRVKVLGKTGKEIKIRIYLLTCLKSNMLSLQVPIKNAGLGGLSHAQDYVKYQGLRVWKHKHVFPAGITFLHRLLKLIG